MIDQHSGRRVGEFEVAFQDAKQTDPTAETNLLDRVSFLAISTGVETITDDLISNATIDNAAQVSSQTA